MLLHDSPSDGYILGLEQISVPASLPDAPSESDAVPNLTDEVVRQSAAALISPQEARVEQVPRWTSDQTDRGQFGVLFHPVTGDCLAGARFDEARHCHVVEHHYPGWGIDTAESECLPRIGDGKDHVEADFPLPHWKFHWQTRHLLQG